MHRTACAWLLALAIGADGVRIFYRRVGSGRPVALGAETNIPLSSTRAWAESLPNGRLVLIERGGHAFPLEQPAAMRDAIERFLRGGSPDGAKPARTPKSERAL
jgi:hypothetical protein